MYIYIQVVDVRGDGKTDLTVQVGLLKQSIMV